MNVSARSSPAPANVDDLALVPGKAELIGGTIVHLMPTGHRPNLVAGRVYRKIAEYTDETGRGVAYTHNMGFVVPRLPSGRQSFSPDVAFYADALPTNPMRFVSGTPDFAVEVRSENDYGAAAELEMAAKRADYFAAGTKVVWDVDPIARLVRAYRAEAPTAPVVFTSGQLADAEPVMPGWRLEVDWLFA